MSYVIVKEAGGGGVGVKKRGGGIVEGRRPVLLKLKREGERRQEAFTHC